MGLFGKKKLEWYNDEIRRLQTDVSTLKKRLDAKIAKVGEIRRLQGLPLDQMLKELKKVKWFTITSVSEKERDVLEEEIARLMSSIEERDRFIKELEIERNAQYGSVAA